MLGFFRTSALAHCRPSRLAGRLGFTLAITAAVAGVAAAGPASAGTPKSTSYTVNLPKFPVTDIVIVNIGSPFTTFREGRVTSPITAGIGLTTLTDTYLTADDIGVPGFVFTPGTTFLFGVTSDLPGDSDGQKHLVLFTNDVFAQSAKDIAFGTLFPLANETTLIDDLETDENVGDLSDFAVNYAVNAGPNGPIAFAPGDSFTAVAFSGGQIIGTGTSAFIASVPEPASWAMMLAGFAVVGFSIRARPRARRRGENLSMA